MRVSVSSCCSLLMLMLILTVERCASFAGPSSILLRRKICRSTVVLPVASEQEQELISSTEQLLMLQSDGVSVVDVTLTEHRPMGCTVEESLGDATAKYVFVASIKEGGHAAAAGVLPGDVIVGITGLFGALEEVGSIAGIDKVKSMVAARPDEDPLQLRLARGTTVMVDHETALTDLCANPDTSDDEVEQCVLEYLQGGYYDFGPDITEEIDEELCDPVNDEDCILDDMHNMWAEDYLPSQQAAEIPVSATTPTPKTKPWSSRVSPSGTYVRDPLTGEMKNIDS